MRVPASAFQARVSGEVRHDGRHVGADEAARRTTRPGRRGRRTSTSRERRRLEPLRRDVLPSLRRVLELTVARRAYGSLGVSRKNMWFLDLN